MKGIKKLLWFLYVCFAFYTLLIYMLILWVPSGGWLAGFMMMSFPAVVLVHLFSIPAWFVVDRKRAVLPVLLVFLAGIFLSRTYGFHGKDQQSVPAGKKDFSVMSYNVHTFNKHTDWKTDHGVEQIEAMKEWIGDSGADVLCMPEYYDEDGSVFNSGSDFRKKGYKYAAHFYRRKYGGTYWGLVTLSKYPIVASKDTVFMAQNGMIQTDVKIGSDTVRVIGLHLFSMTLSLGKLVHEKQMDGIKRESRITFGKMKNGFTQRAAEYDVLQRWVESSPYPVVVCGDFNEVPYGYVYGKLRKSLKNSFEQKGSGFGFTFNHLPYFIRIDHQFYDEKGLDLLDFKTFSDVKYSDHYPIMGTYTFK